MQNTGQGSGEGSQSMQTTILTRDREGNEVRRITTRHADGTVTVKDIPIGEVLHRQESTMQQSTQPRTGGSMAYESPEGTASQEGRGTVPEHIHTPTSHGRNADCEVHARPKTTQGSKMPAHSMTEHERGAVCEMHAEGESSEGESMEDRRKRMEQEKERRLAHKAFNERYDEHKDEEQSQSGMRMAFDRQSIVNGFIWSEILGKPKSMKH